MGLVEYLLENRTPLELAKELAAKAKENVVLRDRINQLEHELFWKTQSTEAMRKGE